MQLNNQKNSKVNKENRGWGASGHFPTTNALFSVTMVPEKDEELVIFMSRQGK